MPRIVIHRLENSLSSNIGACADFRVAVADFGIAVDCNWVLRLTASQTAGCKAKASQLFSCFSLRRKHGPSPWFYKKEVRYKPNSKPMVFLLLLRTHSTPIQIHAAA
jgi:hypothetical protein